MTRDDKTPSRRRKTQQRASQTHSAPSSDLFTATVRSDLRAECVREYRFHPTRRWRFDYAIRLGFHISTRLIRERKAWKQAIKRGNLEKIRMAAFIMRDRLQYGGEATLNDIIKDTYIRQAE